MIKSNKIISFILFFIVFACIYIFGMDKSESDLELDKINITLSLLQPNNDDHKIYLMMYDVSSTQSDVNIKDVSLEIKTDKSYIEINKLEEKDEIITDAFGKYIEAIEKKNRTFFKVEYLNQDEFDEKFNYQDFEIKLVYKNKKYTGEINVVRMLAV